MNLTKQQSTPHSDLVAVRKRIEACGYTRGQAGAICDNLTDKQCDDCLKGKDDKAVESIIKTHVPEDVDEGKKPEQAERFKKQEAEAKEAAARPAPGAPLRPVAEAATS